MAVQLSDKTLGGLQNIAKLESTAGWTKFNQEMKDYLAMNGFGDLLGRNKDRPLDQGALSPKEFEAKQETWLDKQERACAAVRSRLGYNAREEVKDKSVLDEVFLGLKKRFRPTGSAIFQHLDRRYHELTLAECKGVSDFAENLREARNELLELDKTCVIGEPHFVNKFLAGLGPDYDIFLTSFYQTHSLIPEWGEGEHLAVQAVTFEEAVMAAEREEQSQKVREEKTAFLARRGGEEKEEPRCSHCNKAFHTKETCWILHPEKKKAYDDRKKKRASQKKKLNKKKEKTSEEDTEEPEDPTLGAHLAWKIPNNNNNDIDLGGLGGVGVFIASQNTTSTPLQGVYVVDTGCAQHSSCRREDFVSLYPYHGKPLSGIGGVQLMPEGVGTVKVDCSVRGRQSFMLLTNTLYCPTMGVNLISVSQLLQVGAKVNFQSSKAIIIHGQRDFTATQHSGLFLLDL